MNEQVKELADLIVIEPKDALATFTTPGALDPILRLVRERIDAFEADVSTATGRKQVASMAFAVTKSKTALETIGERLAKEAKELPKKIDAGRKYAKDTLDKWRDEVRAPLTEWETAEEARVKKHSFNIESIRGLGEGHLSILTADELVARFAMVDALLPLDCEEFAEEYEIARGAANREIDAALTARRRFDADQAELADLRRLKAEQDAREAAARAAQEAEDRKKADEARITAEVEKAAQRERDAAVAREAALQAQAEAATRREAALAAEREAALKAKTEAAERHARETEERVRREIEAKAQAEKAAQAEREQDREHRREINAKAAAGLAKLLESNFGTQDALGLAKAILIGIAIGQVPHVTINY